MNAPRFWPFRQSVKNGVLVVNKPPRGVHKPPKFNPDTCERNLL